ncbi:Kelch repeat-containing protein [Hyalangium rubrum]|uniref:Kelch repeat-containing protein n=1 Tax=Hyalangium rubrum TaxID=3103134 RepID=A0ABU5HGB0_9BACT|nr:kelch repeat-containing protein [Hyalangium sp. s54d21]MDY7232406.1 kelch repeat-containing protein [Hyalangium sp. s54d21]
MNAGARCWILVAGVLGALWGCGESSSAQGGRPSEPEVPERAASWTVSSNPRLPTTHLTSVLLPSGKVLVAGGDTAELYDPERDSWTATGRLLEPRREYTMSLLPSGKVLVAGGVSVASNAVLASAELYEPSTGTWSATGSMTHPRHWHAAAALPSGQVLVAGGDDGTGMMGQPGELVLAERYDPATGTWTPVASMTDRRAKHTATALPSGQVLVVAGWVQGYGKGNGVIASAELYDPALDTWTRIPAGGRFNHTATLLPSGKVLVVGGMGFTNPVTQVELFDAALNTWADVASLPAAQLFPVTSVLPNGKVLVAGEWAVVGSHAQVYDPATDTWAQTADLNRPRAVASSGATLLPNGKVLVVGGAADAELYDPGTSP